MSEENGSKAGGCECSPKSGGYVVCRRRAHVKMTLKSERGEELGENHFSSDVEQVEAEKESDENDFRAGTEIGLLFREFLGFSGCGDGRGSIIRRGADEEEERECREKDNYGYNCVQYVHLSDSKLLNVVCV